MAAAWRAGGQTGCCWLPVHAVLRARTGRRLGLNWTSSWGGALQLPMRYAILRRCMPHLLTGCRWVPADPLTGLVDRARDVEANLPKERQPVAYAVALAGDGAKDVTSRRVLVL